MKKILFSLLFGVHLIAPQTTEAQVYEIGTIERAPLSFQDESGKWTGFSIELWRILAENLDLTYNFSSNENFAEMIEGVKDNRFDIAIANISITSEREEYLDFSQPIYDSGLVIAANKSLSKNSMLRAIWESGILKVLTIALVVLILVGHLMWFLEGGGHPYFRKKYPQGVFDAFWWAFIIVTMGGFENERPKKVGGRLFALVWILVGLFFISAFTANMTTSLTINKLQSGIEDYRDLKGKNIGAAKGTIFSDFLDKHDINYTEYDDFWEALNAVESGEIDATIGETAILSYYLKNNSQSNIMLAGSTFFPSKFGFAFQQNSPLREQIDIELLKLKENGEYDTLLYEYLGQE